MKMCTGNNDDCKVGHEGSGLGKYGRRKWAWGNMGEGSGLRNIDKGSRFGEVIKKGSGLGKILSRDALYLVFTAWDLGWNYISEF